MFNPGDDNQIRIDVPPCQAVAQPEVVPLPPLIKNRPFDQQVWQRHVQRFVRRAFSRWLNRDGTPEDEKEGDLSRPGARFH